MDHEQVNQHLFENRPQLARFIALGFVVITAAGLCCLAVYIGWSVLKLIKLL